MGGGCGGDRGVWIKINYLCLFGTECSTSMSFPCSSTLPAETNREGKIFERGRASPSPGAGSQGCEAGNRSATR